MSLDRDELDGLLGAYAIDALDDTTRRDVEATLLQHPDLLAHVERLRNALAPLGNLTAQSPADGVAERLMARALGIRAPGRPVDDTADASILDTYASACRNFRAVLDALPDEAGTRPTIYGIDVGGLVAHLAAVEHVIGDRLGLWMSDVDASGGHVGLGGPDHGSTLHDAGELWGLRSAAVVDRIRELSTDDLAARVEVHGIEFDLGEMLAIRAFEVWSHTEDVCRALVLTAPDVEGPVIRAMSMQAIDLLTFFMSRSPEYRTKTIRVTLTGPGGGSWPCRLDRQTTHDATMVADATVVADALDFCRLFADRLDADTAVTERIGDEALLRELLAIAPTFADYGERVSRA